MIKQLRQMSLRVRRLYAIACFKGWLKELAKSEPCVEAVVYAEQFEDSIIDTKSIYVLGQYNLGARNALASIEGRHSPGEKLYKREIAREMAVLASMDSVPADKIMILIWSMRGWLGEKFNEHLTNDLAITGRIKKWSIPAHISIMAQEVYQEQDYGLAKTILADACEDADLDSTWIEHLRSPHGHWRGCWVIDNLIGRN